jgi:uncharacterized protein YndB with AHSA1/START domain
MDEAQLASISTSPDGRHALRFERDLPYLPEDVWAAVSSPERIGYWLSEADVELRPKGRFRLSGQCDVDGEVLEVTPPAVFRWTWPHTDHPVSEVKITVSELHGEASHLTLAQTDLPARHLLDVAAGWHTHLDALPQAILGRRTPFDTGRAARHYRRYAAALRG